MRRTLFGFLVILSALLLPWPVTLALSALGAAVWPSYVEGAAALFFVEGALTPDRSGAAWLPLTAAAFAFAGVAELLRPRLASGNRATV